MYNKNASRKPKHKNLLS